MAAIASIGKRKFMESVPLKDSRKNCIRAFFLTQCGLQWDCKAGLAATVDSAAPGPMTISRSGPVDFGMCVVGQNSRDVVFELVHLLCQMVLLSVHPLTLVPSCALCSLCLRGRPEHMNACYIFVLL